MNENQEKGTMEHATFERIGETIHRARVLRSISIEQIASDLKLNAEYIRGIEEGHYDKLPALAYTRVYIKSLANYLDLHSEELLERFSREMNIETPDPERERRDTLSVKVQGTRQTNPFLPLVYTAIVLVLIVLLIKQGGSKQDDGSQVGDSGQDTVKIDIPADTGTSDDSLPAGVSASVDSMTDSTKVPVPAGDTVSGQPAATPAKKDSASAKKDSVKTEPQKKNLSFKLNGKKDSAWVKVYADGKKVYDGIVAGTKAISYTAKDSFNVQISKNGNVSYRLNGTELHIPGDGAKILKLTDAKTELWTKRQWNSTFGAK